MITDDKYRQLVERGVAYLRVLGTSWEDQEECLSRAMVKLVELLAKFPEEEHEKNADDIWRSLVFQASVDNYRQVRRQGVIGPVPLEPTTDDGYTEDYEAADFCHKFLHGAFPWLTDEEIIMVLALADCDLSVTRAAEYLGVSRTNLYYPIQKLHAKMARYCPEFYPKPVPAAPQPWAMKVTDWSQNYPVVEVCDYPGWVPAFYDPQELVTDQTPVVKLVQLIPGSSPSRHRMTVREYALYEHN